jgi:cellulose synthase/poly-beta-1,6-N-acetylglucosamine synthase-like glycosyltransferase
MENIFWTFLFLSVYPYLIYPAVVYLMAHLFYHPWKKGENASRVTLIVSVYNEEKVIEEKVKNSLSLVYPKDSLEIIVISDGSTDRTNEIVSGFRDSRVVLRAFPERTGKTACLNRVVPQAKGDIVLFTDANSMFPADILLKLMNNFSDVNVGLVSGWTKYGQVGKDEEATGIYSKLEKMTKCWESRVSSCVGADGAIFAIRKTLYKPLDNRDINDFVIPLHVISQGKRVILDPEVYCFEDPAKGEGDEYRRQARITNRTLEAILRNPRFLNPFSFGSVSFFLLSHKLLRFLVPFFVAGTFITNLFLLKASPIYIAFVLMQILFLCLGLANLAGKVEGKLTNLCKFFLVTLAAQSTAWMRRLRGISDVMWTPQH